MKRLDKGAFIGFCAVTLMLTAGIGLWSYLVAKIMLDFMSCLFL